MIIGTLANYDSKSNVNFKKAIGLQCSEQTNNSAHALCFLQISLSLLHMNGQIVCSLENGNRKTINSTISF